MSSYWHDTTEHGARNTCSVSPCDPWCPSHSPSAVNPVFSHDPHLSHYLEPLMILPPSSPHHCVLSSCLQIPWLHRLPFTLPPSLVQTTVVSSAPPFLMFLPLLACSICCPVTSSKILKIGTAVRHAHHLQRQAFPEHSLWTCLFSLAAVQIRHLLTCWFLSLIRECKLHEAGDHVILLAVPGRIRGTEATFWMNARMNEWVHSICMFYIVHMTKFGIILCTEFCNLLLKFIFYYKFYFIFLFIFWVLFFFMAVTGAHFQNTLWCCDSLHQTFGLFCGFCC